MDSPQFPYTGKLVIESDYISVKYDLAIVTLARSYIHYRV